MVRSTKQPFPTVDARGCVHAARCRVQGGDAGGAGVAGACAARGPRHCWAWYVHWYYSRQGAGLSLSSLSVGAQAALADLGWR